MKISEVFYSIQGEGKLAGVPSVFIRTTGCNLRCTWCDSPYTSWKPEGFRATVDEILERVAEHPADHVVLTGGEPLLAEGVEHLTRRLREAGYHLTLETAGSFYKDVECDLASISPKLSNSTPWKRDGGRYAERHEQARLNLTAVRKLMERPDRQLKFVIDRPDDLIEVDSILFQLEDFDPADILLMPQGVTPDDLQQRSPWVADICKRRGFRFCPRLHIALYGNVRGT